MEQITFKLVTNPRTDMRGLHVYVDGNKHTTFVLFPHEWRYVEQALKLVDEGKTNFQSFTLNDLGYWLHFTVRKIDGQLYGQGSILRHYGSMLSHPSFHDEEYGDLKGYRCFWLGEDRNIPVSYEYEDRSADEFECAGIV